MPSKNRIKSYVDGGYYHIYNRGVEKRPIFSDLQDYSVFLSYLKGYLMPKDIAMLSGVLINPSSSPRDRVLAQNELRRNNFTGEIRLIAYSLMPNHYHLLLQNVWGRGIESFMRSLMTRYTGYFNTRNERVGPLFQGIYKAVLIERDGQLIYVTRYIHRNLFAQSKGHRASKRRNVHELLMENLSFSSYPVYIKKTQRDWVKPDVVLSHFAESGNNSYRAFVEDEGYEQESKTIEAVSYL